MNAEKPEQFVSDRSIMLLTGKYPTMLNFYRGQSHWRRDNDRCGWTADAGTAGFFQAVNGPHADA